MVGALVVDSAPDRAVVAGNPARIIGYTTDGEEYGKAAT